MAEIERRGRDRDGFRLDAAQLGKLVFHIFYIYLLVNFLFRCSLLVFSFRFYFISLEDQQQPSRSTTQNVLISAGAVWNRFRPVSASQKSSGVGSGVDSAAAKRVCRGLQPHTVRVRASETHNAPSQKAKSQAKPSQAGPGQTRRDRRVGCPI